MEQLIKRWTNFRDGIGHPKDGEHNGFLGPDQTTGVTFLPCFIGTEEGLVVPPGLTEFSSIGLTDAARHMQHAFVEYSPNGSVFLYILSNSDASSTAVGKVHKTLFGTFSSITTSATTYGRLGHPEKYQGLWYWPEVVGGGLELVELTTLGNGTISGDTHTPSTGDRGGGQLFLLGHQLASISDSQGVRLLVTGDNPVTGTWGAYFPAGDDADIALGAVSLSGLAFVFRDRGIYTFNDRGRAATISEDFTPWMASADLATSGGTWQVSAFKGGAVVAHPAGLLYYRLGNDPIDISVPSSKASVHFLPPNQYLGVLAAGESVWVWGKAYGSANYTLYCGTSADGSPTNLVWSAVGVAAQDISSSALAVFFNTGNDPSNFSGTGTLLCNTSSTANTLSGLPVDSNGSASTQSLNPLPTAVKGLMPTLQLPIPRITKLVVTLDDMPAGSAMQLYGYINESTTSVNFGGALAANARHEVFVNYPDVRSLTLGASYTGSATASTQAKIKLLEVYGEPE